jgi:transporter family-2 protein
MSSTSSAAYLVPAVLAGLVIPFQAAINARLGQSLGHPVFGAVTNFLVGLIAIGLIGLLFARHFAGWERAAATPVWAYLGGLLGVTFVFMSLLAVPKLGAANLLVASVAGQIVAALLIDRFGLVGLPVREITPQRLVGIALVVLGLGLVTYEWKRAGG